MKSEWQSYRKWSRHFVTEIRHPLGRLLIAVGCLLLAAGLLYRVGSLWLSAPTLVWSALVWLAVPVLGAFCLFYVVYLLLFAPVARQRQGVVPVGVLYALGWLIAGAGVWGLTKGAWEALFLLGLGMACVSLAKERVRRKRHATW